MTQFYGANMTWTVVKPAPQLELSCDSLELKGSVIMIKEEDIAIGDRFGLIIFNPDSDLGDENTIIATHQLLKASCSQIQITPTGSTEINERYAFFIKSGADKTQEFLDCIEAINKLSPLDEVNMSLISLLLAKNNKPLIPNETIEEPSKLCAI